MTLLFNFVRLKICKRNNLVEERSGFIKHTGVFKVLSLGNIDTSFSQFSKPVTLQVLQYMQ